MKTTIKEYILENMTDRNFEKIIHTMISNEVFRNVPDDYLLNMVTEHMEELSTQVEETAIDMKQQIINMPAYYIANYKGEFLPRGMKELNDPVSTWQMNVVDLDAALELEMSGMDLFDSSGGVRDLKYFFASYPELIKEQGNFFFDELKFPYHFNNADDREMSMDYIEAYDVDEKNYTEYIEQEKRTLVVKMANFIYEVLHYSRDHKMERPQFEGYTVEESYVKIEKDTSYPSGYAVSFLVDNRTRYISAETQRAYSNWAENEELAEIAPGFVEFETLLEDLSLWDIKRDYMLEPFTSYLNEELTLPTLSETATYDLLEQLVLLLTRQGFIKSEQIQEIKAENESYEANVKHIYML